MLEWEHLDTPLGTRLRNRLLSRSRFDRTDANYHPQCGPSRFPRGSRRSKSGNRHCRSDATKLGWNERPRWGRRSIRFGSIGYRASRRDWLPAIWPAFLFCRAIAGVPRVDRAGALRSIPGGLATRRVDAPGAKSRRVGSRNRHVLKLRATARGNSSRWFGSNRVGR